MATNLRLDYELASAQARVIEADAEEINRILQALISEVEANVNNVGVWTGVSAEQFKSTWERCSENFNSYINHIRTIQEKIDYTATEVSKFDQQ